MIIKDGKTGTSFKVKNRSAYEGASRTARTRTLHAPTTGPNRAIRSESGTLRDRTLAAHRNFPTVYAGIEKNVANEVGSGVTIRAKTESDEFNLQANVLWSEFINQCDPELVINFHGMLTQAVRARRTQGEVFIRKRYRTLAENLPIPIQFQVLESVFCPQSLNKELKGGRKIKQGVEFDRRGRRIAYYFYKNHPNEGENLQFEDFIRVRASDVIHHFLPTRPGQIRGTPDGVQGLLKAITFNSYDDAELIRKEQRAPYTGFIKRAVDYSLYEDDKYWVYDPITGEERQPDDINDIPQTKIEPGMVIHGYQGDEMTLFDADDAGRGYADYMRWQCISIAQTHKLPYELLTGDWKNVNDRLVRIIMQQYYREIEMTQDHLLVFQVCKKCWEWGIDAGITSGRLANAPTNPYEAEYRPQGWDYINPVQDVDAKIKASKHDLTSIDAEVSRKGQNPEEVERTNLKKLARKARIADEEGVTPEVLKKLREIENLQESNSESMQPA